MHDAKTLESMKTLRRGRLHKYMCMNELQYFSLRLCQTYVGKKYKKEGEDKRFRLESFSGEVSNVCG